MLVASAIVRSYHRGAHRVLDGVDLHVEPGERVALTGPSGSGKSTLARIMALLEPPDSGCVELDGELIDRWGLRLARGLRQRVALLWQSPRTAADPRLTVDQLIGEPLRSGGRRAAPPSPDIAAHVATRCEQVGLTGELRVRYPHEISEGQLQRACLARALICGPGYLICDEPTSMLDVSTQAALLDVIATEQQARPLGVLLITHDRTLATHWCHRTVPLGQSLAKHPLR